MNHHISEFYSGSGEYSTAINLGIHAIGSEGGGELQFDGVTYQIEGQPVCDQSNVVLKGVGFVHPVYGGTVFKKVGSSGGTVISFIAPVTGPCIVGSGMDGILVNGNNLSAYGIIVFSLRSGRFGYVGSVDSTSTNMYVGVQSASEWTSNEPRDTQHCVFDSLILEGFGNNGVECLRITGDNLCDTSFCDFRKIFYAHKNGSGIFFGPSDACTFGHVAGYRVPLGTGAGARFAAGVSNADFPRQHLFNYLQAGTGGVVLPTGPSPAKSIRVNMYSQGNGTPAPSIGAGAQFTYGYMA